MSIPAQRDECFYEVSKKNASACGFIDSTADRDICYAEAALMMKDNLMCEYIEEQMFRGWCFAHLNGTVSGPAECYFPGALESTKPSAYAAAADQCYIDAVKTTADGMICLKVKGYEEGYLCRIAYAKAKNDSTLCDGMINAGWRERCRDAFPGRGTTSSIVVTTSLACRTNQCIIDAVRATGDGSLCRMVMGYEEGYLCNIEYAKAKNDSSICEGMLNRGWRERCLEAIANKID